MDLRLVRDDFAGPRVLGTMYVDGARECETLENIVCLIPEGRFRVRLTLSGRAQRGTLYSPNTEQLIAALQNLGYIGKDDIYQARHRLPEIMDVPGRTAIRIHSANKPSELEGCVAVGRERVDLDGRPGYDGIGSSQVALRQLYAKIFVHQDDCWITVESRR